MNRESFVDSLLHWKASDALVAEQFRTLRSQIPAMYLAVLINMAFLAYVSAPNAGHNVYIVPLVVAAGIAIRLAVLLRGRDALVNATVAQKRAAMTGTLAAASLLSLGLSIWTEAIQRSGGEARTYVALFASLCTVSTANCLSSLPLAAYIVVAMGTIPVSLSLLMSGNLMLASMGANMVLIAPLVVGMTFRQYRQLRRMVESRGAIAAEKRKVSDLAYRDVLTGLANRRAFLEELQDASAARPALALAIGMIDLDGFKIINDTYGHQTGDALLVETGKRFQNLNIGDALIARFGGDEFAVLLRGVEQHGDAQARLAQLGKIFDQPFVVSGQAFRLRASIGIAHDGVAPGSTLALINRADLAMYEAKRAHGGGICVFAPEMEARNRRRLMIEQALAIHAESDQIVLQYQPVVDAKSDRIIAFEALARWTHPTLGVISPAEFIPLAEQAGITCAMTLPLLAMALTAAATWPEDIGLSFNLSGAELNSPSIADQILTVVREHGFDAGRLSIEVTETAL
uniref:putative bifunctional diguanylate cyclase/phosphodiesterase n=1 Tax=Sphingomonas sp. TaxID=28214 RepID=UPI00333E6E19